MPSVTKVTTRVDSFGIPLDVHHYRLLGKRDDVWDVAHVLAVPPPTGNDDGAGIYTHVSVLCALQLTSHANASNDA
ncbi:hypothetical protein PF003_g18560 [Phytophthora fragariae]|nr:hypothetical protein PF003_g18560 [Phytophthora fragariae]